MKILITTILWVLGSKQPAATPPRPAAAADGGGRKNVLEMDPTSMVVTFSRPNISDISVDSDIAVSAVSPQPNRVIRMPATTTTATASPSSCSKLSQRECKSPSAGRKGFRIPGNPFPSPDRSSATPQQSFRSGPGAYHKLHKHISTLNARTESSSCSPESSPLPSSAHQRHHKGKGKGQDKGKGKGLDKGKRPVGP